MTVSLAGGYKYVDYIKVGGPINMIMMIIVALVAPLVYGL